MKYSKSRYCRNCHYPLAYKAKFCAQCGQKDTDGRVQVGDLLQQLFFRIFKLESKYFLILWQLFIPGKVSMAYFQGKQKRYPPPIQFFFVVMVFFLFTLSKLISPDNIMVDTKDGGILSNNTRDTAVYQRISLTNSVKRMHEEERQYLSLLYLKKRYQTFPDSLRSPAADRAVDSLLNPNAYDFIAQVDSITLPLEHRQLKIDASELYLMEPDSLLDKYQVTSRKNRILLRQVLKLYTDPTQLLHSFLGNLTWTVFALIGAMAAVLRLLYWRQRRFFVEHFVFLLHQHTANFLVLGLGMWVQIAGWSHWLWWTLVSSWMVTANWRALRLFYGESVSKTTVKFVLFSFAYLLLFILFFAIGLFVVFLIF